MNVDAMRESLNGVEEVLIDVMGTVDSLHLVADARRRLELAHSAIQKINLANTVIYGLRTDICSAPSLLKKYDGAFAISNEFAHRLRQHLPDELWHKAGYKKRPHVLVSREPNGL